MNSNHCRLYIIEGLPCTGKSMTAKFVSDHLLHQGEEALYYDEGTLEHPADYEFHAFMKDTELSLLSPEEYATIKALSSKKEEGLLIPLSKLEEPLLSKILPYKIYDNLPWEVEEDIMLEQWISFGTQAASEETIYIFNCCFLQNPLCEMMMRFNLSYEQILNHIKVMYQAIKHLNPIVIYLKNTQIKNRITEIAPERDSSWLTEVINYHTQQGYGKANHLQGLDGYISCLSKRQEIELQILEALPIKSYIITNPFDDWDKAHEAILDFIKKNQ